MSFSLYCDASSASKSDLALLLAVCWEAVLLMAEISIWDMPMATSDLRGRRRVYHAWPLAMLYKGHITSIRPAETVQYYINRMFVYSNKIFKKSKKLRS